jgi:hypothetical protein
MSLAAPVAMSSDVLLRLRVGGRVLRLGQISDRVLYLREVFSTPPTQAELLITINGREETHPIFLPQGIVENRDAVAYVPATEQTAS